MSRSSFREPPNWTKRPVSGAHDLKLYIAGSSLRSLHAIQNVKRLCEAELSGNYRLEVVDIYNDPQRAVKDRVVAVPTLVKHAPGVVRRLIGDLSETDALRRGLDL